MLKPSSRERFLKTNKSVFDAIAGVITQPLPRRVQLKSTLRVGAREHLQLVSQEKGCKEFYKGCKKNFTIEKEFGLRAYSDTPGEARAVPIGATASHTSNARS